MLKFLAHDEKRKTKTKTKLSRTLFARASHTATHPDWTPRNSNDGRLNQYGITQVEQGERLKRRLFDCLTLFIHLHL